MYSVQGTQTDYVTNPLCIFLLEPGICKGFKGLFQSTFILKSLKTSKKRKDRFGVQWKADLIFA